MAQSAGTFGKRGITPPSDFSLTSRFQRRKALFWSVSATIPKLAQPNTGNARYCGKLVIPLGFSHLMRVRSQGDSHFLVDS
jgi:hypothetical protein